MKSEVSTPLVVAVVVVVLLVVGLFGYRALKSPKSGMTAEQQKQSMRHMLPPN